MEKTMVKSAHQKINGDEFKRLIISASYELEKNKEILNDLNVFPVPDGDTGSNMSMTIGMAVQELVKEGGHGIGEVTKKIAGASLRGARGNSGVIVSLFLRGIAKRLENALECDGISFAEALYEGVKTAYSAVESPADGTILTVAKHSAIMALKRARENNDFEIVLDEVIRASGEALEKTVYENPMLEKAGVVDAGGMGWLIIMNGMKRALTCEDYSLPEIEIKKIEKEEDIPYAYCTEFIIKKYEDATASSLKEILKNMGESLVVIDDKDIVKVHIHTNAPYDVLGKALLYGEYENVKVENMRTQHSERLVKEKKKEYGFVTVASGEGLESLLSDLGADRVVHGGKTMNPSFEELRCATEEVLADTVFVLPNNKNTLLVCEQLKESSKKKITIIPTKSIPQGISALMAFDEGRSCEENIKEIYKKVEGGSTIEITRAGRNSSFDNVKIEKNSYLAICDDRLLASSKELDTIVRVVAEKIKSDNKREVSIYYGEDVTESEGNDLLNDLNSHNVESSLYYGGQPLYHYIISIE